MYKRQDKTSITKAKTPILVFIPHLIFPLRPALFLTFCFEVFGFLRAAFARATAAHALLYFCFGVGHFILDCGKIWFRISQDYLAKGCADTAHEVGQSNLVSLFLMARK